MVWWVREDCCGVFCGFMTIFLLCFALFVQLTFVVGPGLGYFHPLTLFYVYITVMAAVSHMRTQFTNPGAVPLNNDQLIDIFDQNTDDNLNNNSNGKNNNEMITPNGNMNAPSNINKNNDNNNNSNINSENNSNTNNENNNTNNNNIIINNNNNNGGMTVVTHQTDPISRRKQLTHYFSSMQIQPRWCNKCNQYKPSESHHCSTCNRCIIKMDHHCPWVNNCVAMMNQKYFVLFLFYTALCCAFCLISLITRFISCNHNNMHNKDGSSHRSSSSSSSRRGFIRRHSSGSSSSSLRGPVGGMSVVNDKSHSASVSLRNLLGFFGNGDGMDDAIDNMGSHMSLLGNVEGNGNDNINNGHILINNDNAIAGGIDMGKGINDDLDIIYGDWCDTGGLDVMFCMLNMFEGILFGLFTCIMSCDQVSSIMNNVTYIDSIQLRREGRKKQRNAYDSQKKLTGMDNLAFIFGENFGIKWFLPTKQTDKIKKDFRHICSKFE